MTRALVLLGVLVTAAAAQQTPPALETSARLHAAWLREMLDLDVRGAVQEYEAIAADPRTVNLERWIAVARLVELKRIGVPLSKPVPVAEAPDKIRDAVAALRPVDVTRVLTADPAREIPTESPITDETRLPDLRPVVDAAVRWLHAQQGSSAAARLQRNQSQPNRARPPEISDRFAMINAFDVLWRELQGKQEQADVLRRLYFANWKPPVLRGEPGEVLLRVRTNLDAWIGDEQLPSQQRERLRYLRDQLESDPVGKLAMLQRLPKVSERLLAEPTGR